MLHLPSVDRSISPAWEPMEGRTGWTWDLGPRFREVCSQISGAMYMYPCTSLNLFGGKLYQFHPIHMGKPCETPPSTVLH